MSSENNEESQSTSGTTPLLLPSPEDATTTTNTTSGSGSRSGSTTQIVVDGAAIELLDELGPMVVNSDGTLSKIANWAEMTPDERARIVRVLGKRNRLRLGVVNEEQKLRAES